MPPLFDKLWDAKRWMVKHAIKGCKCPCCGQHVQIYQRKLTTTMARRLMDFYKGTAELAPQGGWLHIRKDLNDGKSPDGEYGQLRFWGLLEKHPKKAGVWRLTDEGARFVEGRSTVPRSIFVFNGVLLGRSDDQTTIRAALADKFDYDEMMEGLRKS